MKIFVSVVSFRDPLLKSTVDSLLEQQSGDNEIVIGIFEQTRLEDSLITVDENLIQRPDIRYKRIDPEYADGVVWARAVNATQIEEEDFIYQVDSHIVYDKNWDRYLLEDWELARQKTNNNKAIITSGCYNYTLEDGKPKIDVVPEKYQQASSGKYFTFQRNINLPAAHGEWIPKTDDVMPAIHIFAGNFFAPVRWVDEIGYDPRIFFDGEEHYMVLKSFMHEWSIYHSRAMHCYHFSGTHSHVTKHWVDPISNKYGSLTAKGHARWNKFLKSLPKEVLEKYHEYSGVDYINGIIEERAFTRQILCENPVGTPDAEE